MLLGIKSSKPIDLFILKSLGQHLCRLSLAFEMDQANATI